ncbi:MAG: hypothetical protein JO129_00205 [Candidatus Dependentiae bacterium]|nr:hypothetical protein [Candidatus Dependentiae bacterium]
MKYRNMKKLYLILYLGIFSCLYSSQQNNDYIIVKDIMENPEYKTSIKKWCKDFNQIRDPQLKESLINNSSSIYDYTIPYSIRSNLFEAAKTRKILQANSKKLSSLYKLGLQNIVSFHEDSACKKYYAYLIQNLAFLNLEINRLIPDMSADQAVQISDLSLNNRIVANSVSKDLDYNCLLLSTNQIEDEKKLLVQKKLEKIQNLANCLAPKFAKDCKESARLRGIELKKKRQIQEIAKKEAKKLNKLRESQKRAQQSLKDKARVALQNEIAQEKKEAELQIEHARREEQRIRSLKQAQEDKNRLKKIRQIASQKKVDEEQLFQSIKIDPILESLEQVQSTTISQLSKSDKSLFKPFQKKVTQQLFNSENFIEDQAIIAQLAPIVMHSMQRLNINHEAFSNWIVKGAVAASRDGLQSCIHLCGRSFNGTMIFEKIINNSIDEERFQLLKKMNEDRQLGFIDEQIRNVMEVEKQLLISLFALHYKNNLSQIN